MVGKKAEPIKAKWEKSIMLDRKRNTHEDSDWGLLQVLASNDYAKLK